MRTFMRPATAMILASFATAAPAATLRVLFVGNSYTYVNDLPGLVAAMAATQGVTIRVAVRAEPDYSLADHLRDRRLRVLLAQPWDWVVLQQAPPRYRKVAPN